MKKSPMLTYDVVTTPEFPHEDVEEDLEEEDARSANAKLIVIRSLL